MFRYKKNKHSIRDLKINDKTRKRKDNGDEVSSANTDIHAETRNRVPARRRKKTNIFTFVMSFILFLASAFILYAFLRPTYAIVEIQIKEAQVELASDVIRVAYKDENEAGIHYKIETVSISDSKTVKSDKKDTVKEKASGVLIVYNEYDRPQRIIRNTRFKSPDGKIYRSKNAFVIPAKKGAEPGQYELRVYAEEAGPEYNIDNAGIKFILPALPQHMQSKIYAESKTPIKGGFTGQKAVISDEEKENAVAELKKALAEKAYSELVAKLKDNELMFKDAIILDYDDVRLDYSDDSVTVKLSAKAKVPVFDKFEFARELLLDEEVDGFDLDNEVHIANPQDLDFKLVNKENLKYDEDELIKFTISGTAVVRYYLDELALKNDLLGKPDSIIQNIKEAYPAIASIKAYIKPVWRSSFPDDPEKIEIVIKND